MRTTQDHAGGREPIAVIGSGFRFPGSANNPSKLWETLLKPGDLRSKIPKNRFNADSFYHPDSFHHGTTDVRESYFLKEDHRQFDAAFFNIKPVEAHAIDPQQRLLMEVVYESLEASGTSMESLAGSSTGVYVGLMCADYAELVNNDLNTLPTYTSTGNARSIMSNRLSYFFDWHGPSMTIDTACSSSLVAVHEAVQLLRSGDSDVAIAAGANLMVTPLHYIAASKLKMLSASSRSRMWDVDASGYARGEGVAAVVLKRLSSAIADGDHIECVIRETGLNQDGRTKGITMPSSTAQTELIATTYAKAGLDPKNPAQRCQYFEAHGTGTPAGDPKEAEAISQAFFHPGEDVSGNNDPLYVGSIKTVIGHTEGTAGLAGLLKASLAVQNGIIPPNLLFNHLHPNIEPFYTNLKVPTEPTMWPKLPEGVPRRCSVNSFGFGGSNAHVIIENYADGSPPPQNSQVISTCQLTPCIFSATSEKSLRGVLADYSDYLRLNPELSIQDLSYTLYARRTEHAVRTYISAVSATDLCAKIDDALRAASSGGANAQTLGVRSKLLPTAVVRALGVFTGQGAQWPTMGRELILQSPYCRDLVLQLDGMLQKLPETERPEWSLLDELMCDAPQSRLNSAVIAQPLCTVVQILLHDLLTSSGVRFQAVVGHSSGEIAAAYAAGYLARDDAVKIAYYRGYFTNLTPAEYPGAMMAVGTSADDANELCNLSMFKGRLAVAAINSPSSVTLSGDRDAIEQAKEVLEDEKKFARILNVDKAYHSSHMEKCAEGYLEALKRSKINPLSGREGCVWYSSTHKGSTVPAPKHLAAQYWTDNMVQPVLFYHAVHAAAAAVEAHFDFAVEVGPHPTLKGPVLQTLRETHEDELPYTGLLHRGKNDVYAFSDALGYLWSRFAPSVVDLGAFDAFASHCEKRNLMYNLPTYHWDHDTIFWHKSRATKAFLSQRSIPNPLLGTRTTDAMEGQILWRNHLLLSELPWIRGHQLQGQIIYPATAYLSTAVEAAIFMVPEGANASLIEVQDFKLGKPLVFGESGGGIETVFTLSDISKVDDKTYSASFIYHASSNADAEHLSIHATGRVVVTTGETSPHRLPSQDKDLPNLVTIPEDRFYNSLETVGYAYTGYFKTMSSIKRKLNFSSSEIRVPPQDEEPSKMLLHPALLDTALQGIFLAYCWPGDGSLDQLQVPTEIQTCRVNVGLCRELLVPDKNVLSSAQLTGNPQATKTLNGDVEICADDGTCLVQMEGLKVVSFAEQTADADRAVFTEYVWDVLEPNCVRAMGTRRATEEDYDLAYAIERVSVYYMKQLATLFPEALRSTMDLEWHFVCLFNFVTHVLETTEAGQRKTAKKEWLQDNTGDIDRIKARFAHTVDMQLAQAVGDNLPAVLRGETSMLEHLTKNNLLDRFYEVGLGLKEFSGYLGKTVEQAVHRHPHMKMLEIGAGTGGATKVIMAGIGRAFSSYTYTDISPQFFETASAVFASVADKMIFKTLDVEKDIVQQGYEEHSYDLVVASLVLHATTDLKRTLTNTRRLLKPGGYLVIQEVCNDEPSRTGFMMCALPGWWLGQDDDRKLSPCVSTSQWHDLLVQTGFSGVDSATHELDSVPFQLAVIVSQAVDDRVSRLREPLALVECDAPVDDPWDLVLIGGQTVRTAQLVEQILGLVRSPSVTLTIFETIDELDGAKIAPETAILCLEDLDQPVFRALSAKKLEGMKRLFETQRTILWVTQGSRAADPYMNMSVGLGRTLILENPDLVLQFLDLETGAELDPRQLLANLLRLRQSTQWGKEGNFDDVLWTNEHELAYEDGELILSRVHLAEPLNNRFNASKRTVLETKNPQVVPLNLLRLGSRPSSKHSFAVNDALVARMHSSPRAMKHDPEMLIKVTHSLLMPNIATSLASYVVLGTTEGPMGKTVIAISENNGSYAVVSTEDALEVDLDPAQKLLLLSYIGNHLLVDNMLSICEKGSVLVIHEPQPNLASVVVERGATANIQVCITSASSADSTRIRIDAYSRKSVIKESLPPNISAFVDCSESDQSERVGSLIASCLPDTCLKTTVASLLSLRCTCGFSVTYLRQRLKVLLHGALEDLASSKDPTHTLPLTRVDRLVEGPPFALPTPAILDWSTLTAVPVKISPVDSHIVFRSDRTYVFFGLTSDLAQSICDWMVLHGARNIVLTSRSPNIDDKWKRLLTEAGVRVEVFANDITDMKALVVLVNRIRQTFPPIAGIAHGAMVLDDVSFFEMSFEQMTRVLQPKVQGAIYLDQLFQSPTLDFCIFFSSCTAIAGNRGQSAYTAANMFMSSLASQRREKGLAGSILHIGAVMGVGYINRGFKEYIFTALSRAGYMMVSEREFHLCFGEAVLASHPKSKRNPDVVTALETSKFGDTLPLWAKFPRFQYCLAAADRGTSKQIVDKKQTASVSTKARLAEATSAEEVLEIVQDSFTQKLRAVLQIPDDTERSHVLETGTDDLGIDSLVAVEIRSWFIKEMNTEVAVFKVLSGITIGELVEFAVASMPTELTPNRAGNVDARPESERSAITLPLTPGSASSAAGSLSKSPPQEASQQSTEQSSKTSSIDDKQLEEQCSIAVSLEEASETTYEKVLPVSPGQARFWFLKHLMEDQTTANNTILVFIQGPVKLDNLEAAVRQVAARHESLRTSFFMDESQKPVQAVSEASRLYLQTKFVDSKPKVEEEFNSLRKHVYDIEHGDCMQLVYLGITTTEHYLLIGSHHIVMDGVSLEVFLNDIQKAYNGQSLSDHVYQYSDYSQKLRQALERGDLQDEIEYWKSEFPAAPSPLPMIPFAAAKQRKSLTAYEHTSVGRTVGAQVTKQVSETCRRLKANIFHFYLGVLEVLLFKLFGTSDICIGMADANRWDDQVSQSIGMYLNLLPLRFHLDGKQSFESVLKETRKKAYSAMSNSRLPFDVLLDNLDCERSTVFSPLFQAFINYRQGVRENRMLGTATGSTEKISLPRAAYDISLDIIENPGGETRLTFMLQKALYSEKETSQLMEMYYNLLSDLSGSSAQILQKVSLFSELDISNAVRLGRGPIMPSLWPKTLPDRIDAMIAGRPEDISLREISGKSWTWSQLGEEINRVSSALLKRDIKPGSVIAVYQHASPGLVFSLLAVLRVGAIYVPLDCNLPDGRLHSILAECKPAALLLDGSTLAQADSLRLPPSVAVLDISTIPLETTLICPVTTHARDAAAILFTSGSTGVPKGVILSHESLRNHVEALIATHGFGCETVLQQSSVGFDMSLNQIFMALANGGTLIIVPESLRKDSSAVAKIILDHNITYTSATPSEYLAWVRHGSDSLLRCNSWKFATAGGEQFTPQLLQAFQKLKEQFRRPFHVINAYGPTECCLSSNELEISLQAPNDASTLLSAGKALPNCVIYIVDENATPLPIGFPGEICIGGAGVALGYLNNTKQSEQKFLKDLLVSASAAEKGWNKMYRTGDKGILGPDGTLRVLGRIEGDTQIKLRGIRVEMQDIERTILDASGGRLVEVIVTPRGAPTILVAHAVVSASAPIDNVQDYLRVLSASLPLPQYMRPAAIIPIASMPLNTSGKVDRRALQKLDLPSTPKQSTEPTRRPTEIESRLAHLWEAVLPQQLKDVYAIDETSDFFHVGGNSMLLIELRALIKSEFQVELPLLRFFESSTLGTMAAAIQDVSSVQETEIDWDAETRVPPDYSQLSTQQTSMKTPGSHKTIVVTGATGFLGIHLVRLLVAAPIVNKVHCIAVRNSEKLAEFADSEKVVIHQGNLLQLRCGLSESDAASIFNSADAILHNGADVSFLKSYSSLRESNVLSTTSPPKCLPAFRQPSYREYRLVHHRKRY